MLEANLPENEQQRLAILRRLNILDTPLEERFERITRTVCRALNVPIAAVSLLDESRQWFKSIQGLNTAETERRIAFCGHTILSDELLVVPDATLDARFVDNPLVTQEPNIRFYAGYPLSLTKDIRIGTLCAIDQKPRELSSDEFEVLRDLGRMVESELTAIALSEEQIRLIQELNQAQRLAKIDCLTRLWNRDGMTQLINREWNFAQRQELPVTIVMVDFDDFKYINDRYGHIIGDEVLRHTARILLENVRTYDAIGRFGGDEFMMIIPGCYKDEIDQILSRLQTKIKHHPVLTATGTIPISLSMGAATIVPRWNDTIERWIAVADQQLLQAKKDGKGCVVSVNS